MIRKGGAYLHGLTQWRALVACFAAGALMTLAFAPFYFWPALFIALPIFYRLMCSATTVRQAALRGFFFGYGHAMAGTWWIANALLVEPEKFGWLVPFSVLGLSGVMALWFALFGWWVQKLRSPRPLKNLLRFVALWVLIEYLRSLGMFGFPWNLAGYAALAVMPVAQLASVVGVYGLSFFVLLVALLPTLYYREATRPMRLLPLLLVVVMVIAAYGYGAWRIQPAEASTQPVVRIVQPSIPQNEKWIDHKRVPTLDLLGRLTENHADSSLIIWPETALPYTLHPQSELPAYLAQWLAPHQRLLTGTTRAEGTRPNTKLWNSLVVIDAKGAIQARYDKHHLVPFGEFMPLRDMLPLEKITAGDLDFSRGAGPQTLKIDGLPPFSPLICYEILFPWEAVDAKNRPEWLINITNDAWYGDSPGPYQHLAAAQMRAIEQGLPVFRAANNGISAIISPYGQVLHQLRLNERGSIAAPLPVALPPTLYTTYREALVMGLILLLTI
jgi:apolipoprotein N-acyltransferase